MENNHIQESIEEKITWHKPRVQKLTINVDTQLFAPGLASGPIDFAGDG